MAMQFTTNNVFSLRATSWYRRRQDTDLLKVGEPGAAGQKVPDGTKVQALEPAKGLGGWHVKIVECTDASVIGLEGYCDSNKIKGNEAQYVDKVGPKASSGGSPLAQATNGKVPGAKAVAASPLEKLQLLLAEQKGIALRQEALVKEIKEARSALQKALTEMQAAAEAAGILETENEETETDDAEEVIDPAAMSEEELERLTA